MSSFPVEIEVEETPQPPASTSKQRQSSRVTKGKISRYVPESSTKKKPFVAITMMDSRSIAILCELLQTGSLDYLDIKGSYSGEVHNISLVLAKFLDKSFSVKSSKPYREKNLVYFTEEQRAMVDSVLNSLQFRFRTRDISQYGVATINNDLYLVGGFSTGHGNVPKKSRGYDYLPLQEFVNEHEDWYRDDLWKFDLLEKSWTKLAPMPTPRDQVGTAVVGDKLYVLGGEGGRDYNSDEESDAGLDSVQKEICLDTVELYDPASNDWMELSSMMCPRANLATVVYKECIFAIGGFNEDHHLNSIERYDISSDTWSTVGHMFTPRSGATAVVVLDKVFIFGGYVGTHSNGNGAMSSIDGTEQLLYSIECFSVEVDSTIKWHSVSSMLDSKGNFTACMVENGRTTVITGFKKDVSALSGAYERIVSKFTIKSVEVI